MWCPERWPKEMIVYRDTSDPPSTERDRKRFDGVNTVRWTEDVDLDPDIYYYRLRPNSDTGDAGTWTSSMGLNLGAIPTSPSWGYATKPA